MFFLLGRFHQRIDDISQHVQRLVYTRGLPQSLPFNTRVLHSLATGEVDYVELGLLDLDHVVLLDV
jgi:hypothetical protein